jgi:hypothetical protein
MAEVPDQKFHGWSINRNVPVVYVGAIFFQTVVFLIIGTAWVTQTNARLDKLEEFMRASIAIQARLAVLESKAMTLDRIEADIRQILIRQQPPPRQ